jgi:hypothetical protein
MVTYFAPFMETKGSLMYSKQPTTSLYPEPDESSKYHPLIFKLPYTAPIPERTLQKYIYITPKFRNWKGPGVFMGSNTVRRPLFANPYCPSVQ